MGREHVMHNHRIPVLRMRRWLTPLILGVAAGIAARGGGVGADRSACTPPPATGSSLALIAGFTPTSAAVGRA